MFDAARKRNSKNPAVETVKVPAYAWRTCLFLSSTVILVLFVHSSLSPALPLFVSEFGISYTLASWALTAYMISGAVMTIIIGRLADLFGSRKMLLIELACFAIGTALAGFAHDFYTLLIIRALQGIAVANTPLALKIVREQFPKEKFSIGSSVIVASFSGGIVLGLLVGAWIVGDYGWREVFYASAPVAFAMLFVAWRYIGRKVSGKERQIQPSTDAGQQKEQRINQQAEPEANKKRGINVKNAIALAFSLTSFLLAITFAGTLPKTTLEFAVFLGIGSVSIAIFFLLERRSSDPLINPRVMYSRLMIGGNTIFLFAGVIEYLIFQSTPTLATAPYPSGFGLPVAASGLIQLPYAAMVIIFGIVAGVYISRKGPMRLLLPGAAITVAAVGLLAAFHGTFLGTMIALTILGVGFTFTVTTANFTMITTNPLQFTGLISSTTTDLRVIGGSIGPIIAGTLMSLFVVPYQVAGNVEYYPSQAAFNYIFLTAFLVAVFQAVLILRFRQRASKLVQQRPQTGDTVA